MTNKAASLAIRMENVTKTYGAGSMAVPVLKGVNLEIFPGEVVGLLGASGSGKTTLLHCLGAIIDPGGGKIELAGEVIYDNGWLVDNLRALRRDKIGFVFQAAYLIPFISVLDNVALLPMLAGQPNDKARERAMELLRVLEVDHRALANKPPFILADEPTAPLDSARALIVMRLLIKLAEQYRTAIIVVTHDDKILPHFKRLYRLRDGIAYEEQGQGLEFSDENRQQ